MFVLIYMFVQLINRHSGKQEELESAQKNNIFPVLSPCSFVFRGFLFLNNNLININWHLFDLPFSSVERVMLTGIKTLRLTYTDVSIGKM